MLSTLAVAAFFITAPPDDTVRRYLVAHCTSCHEGDDAKGQFRLEALPADLAAPQAVRTWANALERVERGEMPPSSRKRPPTSDTAAFTKSLERDLLAIEAARIAQRGRGSVRRLNRIEYENSVRSILGIPTELKELLPDDAGSDGFDTVGAGLSVSSILLERYLEAADRALDAVLIPPVRPVSQTVTVPMTPVKFAKGKEADYRMRVGVRELPGDAYVLFNSSYQPNYFERFKAPTGGLYRVRVSAYAYQNQGRPLMMAVYAGVFNSAGAGARLVDFYAVPADHAQPVAFTLRLPAKGSIKVETHGLGSRDLALNAPYTGPGLAIEPLTVEGPLAEPPPVGRIGMFGTLDLSRGTLADADAALRWLLPRLFRRPVAEDEIAPYRVLIADRLTAQQPFDKAIRAGLKAALCSPDFLLIAATGPMLNDHELATRLALFLTSGSPDAELRVLADASQLRNPRTLRQQAERLLKAPTAAQFTENFAGQWLGLRKFDDTTPDPKLYPEYDRLLARSMAREPLRFFDELLQHDLPVSNFVRSEFAMLDERLAQHYGIGGVVGTELRRVPLPPGCHRGGLLTQAAILKVTANGTTTSPVVRGVWVLRNLVGRPTPPPPPDVPAIEPDIRGAHTVRELLAKHRDSAACARCHNQIDPYGLAMESYDPIGGYRDRYRVIGGPGKASDQFVNGRRTIYRYGPAVDPSGGLVTGERFNNLEALQALLLNDEHAVARCIAGKLLTYGTGTPVTFGDRPAVDGILQRAEASHFGLRSLVLAVVESSAFRAR